MRVVIDTEPSPDIRQAATDDPFAFEIPDSWWVQLQLAEAEVVGVQRAILRHVVGQPGAEYIREYLAQEADRG